MSLLFDSYWRQNGDQVSKARQSRHHNSLAEQVMASRNEVLHLQGELDRLSHDLTQVMTLNRMLLKVLVSEGVCSPDQLEEFLRETLAQNEVELGPNETLSRFCEDCGRPLTHQGRACPYCTELDFPAEALEPEPSEPAVEDTATKKKTKTASKDKSSEAKVKTKKRRRSSKQK